MCNLGFFSKLRERIGARDLRERERERRRRRRRRICALPFSADRCNQSSVSRLMFPLRAAPPMLSMWPCLQYFSHPRLVIYLFLTSPILKLKLGLQMLGDLLIATHLYQSNNLANEQQVGVGF
jgi:hypothetical protein